MVKCATHDSSFIFYLQLFTRHFRRPFGGWEAANRRVLPQHRAGPPPRLKRFRLDPVTAQGRAIDSVKAQPATLKDTSILNRRPWMRMMSKGARVRSVHISRMAPR